KKLWRDAAPSEMPKNTVPVRRPLMGTLGSVQWVKTLVALQVELRSQFHGGARHCQGVSGGTRSHRVKVLRNRLSGAPVDFAGFSPFEAQKRRAHRLFVDDRLSAVAQVDPVIDRRRIEPAGFGQADDQHQEVLAERSV